MLTKMVLRTSLFSLLLLLVSCTPSLESKGENADSNPTQKVLIDAPNVDVTPEQLAGIWEIIETRTHPDVKGTEPDLFNAKMIFGFTKDARMSTTSLGFDYMKETLEYSTIDFRIDKGVITSADDNAIFKMQWGEEGIRVVKIGKDELCLWYSLLGSKKDLCAYFKRID
jgi:hypothetical protein